MEQSRARRLFEILAFRSRLRKAWMLSSVVYQGYCLFALLYYIGWFVLCSSIGFARRPWERDRLGRREKSERASARPLGNLVHIGTITNQALGSPLHHQYSPASIIEPQVNTD